MEMKTRVLLVDDDPNLLRSMSDILNFKGYETVQATKGGLALDIIKNTKIEVALVDLRLEDISGLELLREIKRISPMIEVLLLTGHATQVSAIEAVQGGAFGYYQKPVDVDQVILAIQQAAEKNHAAVTLAASERRFRALIENGRDYIVVTDRHASVIWVSPSVIDSWGYSQSELEQMDIWQVIDPQDKDEIQALILQLLGRPGDRFDATFRVHKKNGDLRWVESSFVNMLLEPEVEGIVVNFRDITNRKEADDQLALQGTALAAAANAILITDKDAHIQWVNPAFEELTGYKLAEVIGQTPRVLKSGIQGDAFYERLWQTILSGHEWHCEMVNKRKNGTLYTEDLTITPVLDNAGTVKHFVGIKQDITEKKRDQEKLQLSESRYRRLFEDSPIAVLEEDFSAVKQRLDALKRRGVTDWKKYFSKRPELVSELGGLVKIIDVNNAAISFHGATSKEQLHTTLSSFFPKERNTNFIEELTNFAEGKLNFSLETCNLTYSGKLVNIIISLSVTPGFEENLGRVIVSIVDISDLKKREQEVEIQNRELNLLYQSTRVLNRTLKLRDLYDSFYKQISSIMSCDALYISKFNPDTQLIIARFAVIDGRRIDASRLPTIPLGEEGQGIQSPVIREGKPKIFSDYQRALTTTHRKYVVDRKGEVTPSDNHTSNVKPIQSALVLPILLNNRVDGAIQIQSYHQNAYTENDLTIAESLVSQIAIAANNAELYQKSLDEIEARKKVESEIRRTNEIQRHVVNLGRELAATLDAQNVYRTAVRSLRQIVDCPEIGIYLYDEKKKALNPSYLIREDKEQDLHTRAPIPLNFLDTVSSRSIAIATKKPVIGSAQSIDHETQGTTLNVNSLNIQSEIFIPMLAEKKIIGLLHLGSKKTNIYTAEVGEGLTLVANQIGLAIQNANLHTDLVKELRIRKQAEIQIKQHLDELEILYDNALSVSSVFDPEKIAKTILKLLKRYFHLNHVEIHLKESDNEELRLVGFSYPELKRQDQKKVANEINSLTSRRKRGLVGWVVENGETLRLQDVRSDPRYIAIFPEIRSGLFVPLRSSNQVIGCIAIESEKPEAFGERDERLLETIASQAAIAFENARLYQEVQHELEERIQTETALRQSESRFRAFIEQASEGVMITDENDRIIEWNSAQENITGYAHMEVLGKPYFEVIGKLFPDEMKGVKNAREVLEKLKEIPNQSEREGFLGKTQERILTKPDGQKKYVLTVTFPMQTGMGLAIGTFITDIHDRKQAELELIRFNQVLEERVRARTEELHNANLALEKASRLKDEFLANMSHELRTPLTGVLGLSEALQKGVYGDLSEKQNSIVHIVEEAGRHLLNLINDILDLSKIEAGKMDFQPNLVEVGEVCQSSLRMVKQLATARQQKVSFTIHPDGMVMYADSKRLKEILVNLLGNAVKFTPEHGELGLEVQGDEKADFIRFTVWDNGIGVAEDDLDKMFQPFVQLDSSLDRSYAGTGLGLALAESLAKLHNGHIEVESKLGEGSRFTVVLPWHRELVNQPQTEPDDFAARFVSNIVSPNQKPNGFVLIVEDNPVNNNMLADFLSFHGFNILAALDGQKGLNLAETENPDIILMDIQMPGMNGLEVIRRIRALNGKNALTPIIALTALAMPEDQRHCLDAGANDYVAKPVDYQALLEKIWNLIHQDKQEDSLPVN